MLIVTMSLHISFFTIADTGFSCLMKYKNLKFMFKFIISYLTCRQDCFLNKNYIYQIEKLT